MRIAMSTFVRATLMLQTAQMYTPLGAPSLTILRTKLTEQSAYDTSPRYIYSHRSSFYLRLALDLTEVFFQIVHTRLPLLNPAQFRARLKYAIQGPGTSGTPNGMLGSGMSSSGSPNAQQVTGFDQKPLHPASVFPL